eukprot:CAMPEP_0170510660 /NCGR_PEP_ID=MMETSP0208-20121228/65886_1 /TAXON_ID=197538 /ORGANISM="Strombidium inclinatum, Strain S3" /LENGTH=72 /DNA_ID=CAMNT_0010794145 /DNA_START=1885 /DNA_END=2103 /DNA_ORIENTATION=-
MPSLAAPCGLFKALEGVYVRDDRELLSFFLLVGCVDVGRGLLVEHQGDVTVPDVFHGRVPEVVSMAGECVIL